ncbi:hypothetical protein BRADI_3g33416v3 [Brachypodium distachyon]|uniref:Vegetative cell wall protein gp1-like n=1 Tax=Brachypodium distachyon TaxID=15368 RepID=A0A2K2D0U0_BRADI|nr:hypothetical protein BRADI_3g33416v3 [Brachypodium distachyon]
MAIHWPAAALLFLPHPIPFFFLLLPPPPSHGRRALKAPSPRGLPPATPWPRAPPALPLPSRGRPAPRRPCSPRAPRSPEPLLLPSAPSRLSPSPPRLPPLRSPPSLPAPPSHLAGDRPPAPPGLPRACPRLHLARHPRAAQLPWPPPRAALPRARPSSSVFPNASIPLLPLALLPPARRPKSADAQAQQARGLLPFPFFSVFLEIVSLTCGPCLSVAVCYCLVLLHVCFDKPLPKSFLAHVKTEESRSRSL